MKYFGIVKLSCLYAGVSVVLGPALLLLSSKLFPKQVACFDLESSVEYYLLRDGGPTISHKELVWQYHAAALFLTIGSVIMMVVGVLLLKLVLNKQSGVSRKYKIILSTMVIAVLTGYVLILAYAALNVWCASK